MSTTKIHSTCRIANIGPDDAMILAHAANPDGSNFRKGQVFGTQRFIATIRGKFLTQRSEPCYSQRRTGWSERGASPFYHVRCQRFPCLRLRNSELSGDSRWRDARLECGAYSVQLPLSQRSHHRVRPPLWRAFMRNGKLLTASLLLSEHSCKQSVEFFVGKLLDGVGRICGQDMPYRR
jgi:hypothetical protein